MKELGDKISGEEKAKIETEMDNVKKALEGTDTENIKQATEKLTQVFYELSEKLYKQANPNAGAGAGTETNTNPEGPTEGTDGNVYNADYNVEDNNNDNNN